MAYPGSQEFYDQRSFGSHLLHGFLAPTSFVNPFFYHGLYESTQDDTSGEFVAEHLFYLSPWIPAAAVAGVTPFHLWSGGLSISRYLATDAGLLSLPTLLLAGSVAATAGWIATAEHHGAVTPGVASGFGMPITNPGAAHSPTPYRQGLRDMFGLN